MAESVCAGDEIAKEHTLELIASLVGKSLMVAETSGRTEARYRLLEMIREYALEKLKAAGEIKLLRDRHLDFFATRVEEIAPKLQQGSAYQGLWMTWLDGERDNIRAALEWSLESGQVEAGLRIANGLFMYWMSHGPLQEDRNWHERLLAQAGEQIPIMLRAHAAFNAGMMAGFMGDATAASEHERTAVALCEAAGEEGLKLLAQTQALAAVAATFNGDFAVGYIKAEKYVQLLQKVGYDAEIPMGLATQAVAAIGLGKYQIARALLEEALPAQQKIGDPYLIALILSILGHLEHWEQNYTRAQAAYEESLALLRKVGGTGEEPRVLQGLAHTRLQQGDLDQAYTFIFESAMLCKRQGKVEGLSECLIGFGVIAAECGMPYEAVRLLTTGAAHGVSVHFSFLVAEGREYERYLASARSQLTEREFEQAQLAGRSQTLEGAIEYALSLPLMPASPASKANHESGGLSEREREIVALIVQGKRNSEIAEQLVLSKRTVEKHVANILSKLELSNRSQIVRWAIEHNITKLPS